LQWAQSRMAKDEFIQPEAQDDEDDFNESEKAHQGSFFLGAVWQLASHATIRVMLNLLVLFI